MTFITVFWFLYFLDPLFIILIVYRTILWYYIVSSNYFRTESFKLCWTVSIYLWATCLFTPLLVCNVLSFQDQADISYPMSTKSWYLFGTLGSCLVPFAFYTCKQPMLKQHAKTKIQQECINVLVHPPGPRIFD